MKILLSAALLFILSAITACGGSETEEDVYEPYNPPTVYTIIHAEAPGEPEFPTPPEGFHLYIPADSITPTGLYLQMINNSDEYFFRGTTFTIQQCINGLWKQVPFLGMVGWNRPLIHIPPRTTQSQQVNWTHMHGILPVGTYRFVREFSCGNALRLEPWQEYYIVFTIGDEWANFEEEWQQILIERANIIEARFAGLDVEIHSYNTFNMHFTLTNNNATYAYFIDSIFVTWFRETQNGTDSDTVYRAFPNGEWLGMGESFTAVLDWSDTRIQRPEAERTFRLEINVTVDADYTDESLRFQMPGPYHGMWHRITAEFDV
ncbi:MAG: hypothetical protein FWC16_02905 [Defluviitaleaceae bacterium]|nr:hypothetical protein [Defluviitaleaceae bacterium]MCL2273850.1 hypothetical protein [Defluviitaleaceae bacterium]